MRTMKRMPMRLGEGKEAYRFKGLDQSDRIRKLPAISSTIESTLHAIAVIAPVCCDLATIISYNL